MNTNTKTPIAKPQFWVMLWSLGLAGQLCWNIENQWFNTFVYTKIEKNSTLVTIMVVVSALVTTFSTFLFGTLSDRKGNRRHYISVGYIVWGILTIAFGLTEFITGGTVGVSAKSFMLAGVLVVVTDSIMSFFGSMGNDSGFNAWINDMTTDQNRGSIGAVLAVLPVVGTIAGTILGGILVGDNDNYQRLFWAMGIFVILVGIFSLLFLKDAPTLRPHKEGSFWQQFSSIFQAKGFFAHKELLLACLTTAVFFIAFNVYFVHMGNWMISRMGFAADQMGIIQGVGLLLAALLVIPGTRLVNQKKTPLVAFCAVILNIIGLVILFTTVTPRTVDTTTILSTKNIFLFIGIFLAGGGYILIVQSMTMWVKELYPEESRGQFEGMRMVFFTLLPMIVGTIIGNIVITNSAGTFVNDVGITENIPTENIYLCASILVLFTFIPLYKATKLYRKRILKNKGNYYG